MTEDITIVWSWSTTQVIVQQQATVEELPLIRKQTIDEIYTTDIILFFVLVLLWFFKKILSF